MSGHGLRRLLTMTVIALYLAAVAGAIAAVQFAGSRQWYIDGAGVDLTLDMAFTSTGRWLATAVLGFLALVGVLALMAEAFAGRRRLSATAWESRAIPPEPAAISYTPSETRVVDGAGARDGSPNRLRRATYSGMIVGDEVTQRMERPVPSTPADAEAERPSAKVLVTGRRR